jgi:ComF family protein
MLSAILELLFPRVCIGCGRSGAALCAICERSITAKPVTLDGGVAALYEYRNPLVKKAIWRLKFRNDRAMGAYFGVALYREFFRNMLALPDHARTTVILVPIPLSRTKGFLRPFNHAEVIAQTIAEYAEADQLPIELRSDLLRKTRDTRSQVETIGRDERLRNLDGAFKVELPSELRDATIVLIDDVVTTGATMREAKRAFQGAGAKRVLGLAVAH